MDDTWCNYSDLPSPLSYITKRPKKLKISSNYIKTQNMPNFCFNEITISGEIENVQKIVDKINEYSETPEEMRKPHQGLFLTLIGLPEGVTEITDDNWYDTNLSWLGTKWDIFPPMNMDYSDGLLFLSFDTAWTPPSNFCKELAKQYDVTVENLYMEQGNDFCGKEVYVINGIVEEVEYSYMEGLYHLKQEEFEYEFQNELDYYNDNYGEEESESDDDEVSDEEIKEAIWAKYDFISNEDIDIYVNLVKESNLSKELVNQSE